MIPKIATGGSSFKGAFQYYLHDKGRNTRDRVAWTHTENLLTDDADKAAKVMAYTAKEAERLKEASGQKMTGRKLTKPVFAYSLSWHPEQDPDKEHMLTTARQSFEALGLTEYEILIVAHRDEPQKHVHIIVNRVHPLTGIAVDLSNSKLKLSDFARQYELEHGKVYCPQREANHRKRERGERVTYHDPNIVTAWEQSDNGRGFAAALREKANRTEAKEEGQEEKADLILATGLQRITPKQALNAASERFRAHLPMEQRALNWNDLVEAAYRLKPELHISQKSWGEACITLGRAGAAVCLLLTDQAMLRKTDPVQKPGAYFRAMINRANSGELHLHNSVFGILKREEG